MAFDGVLKTRKLSCDTLRYRGTSTRGRRKNDSVGLSAGSTTSCPRTFYANGFLNVPNLPPHDRNPVNLIERQTGSKMNGNKRMNTNARLKPFVLSRLIDTGLRLAALPSRRLRA